MTLGTMRRGCAAIAAALLTLGIGLAGFAADPAVTTPVTPAATGAKTAAADTATTPRIAPAADSFTLSPVYVNAEKREQDAQDVPASFTVVSGRTLQQAGVTTINETGGYVPNLTFSAFTASRESFPFIRGIGSGRNSPAVTTYIDGVPQLSFATSNQQLVDIDHIEFLRGPQGTLYGRNTLGGVINVYSRRPTNDWSADLSITGGNYNMQDYRGVISGPLVKDQLYISVSGGFFKRDGYTENTVTGHDLDHKEESFGRVQILWTPTKEWDIRLSLNGEHDHDGDFGLNDLASVRSHPFRVQRDFEGFTHRDFWQPALVASYKGPQVDFTSITAYQFWRSHEVTDLDYTPADLIRRDNSEKQKNFYQELRLSSSEKHPVVLCKEAKLSWIIGASGFTSDYKQLAGNEFRPNAVALFGLPAPLTSFEQASLSDWGVGVFGQSTLTIWDKLDLTAGIRYDYEQKGAHLANFASIAPAFGTTVNGDDSFDQFSPKFAVAYHCTKDVMIYGSAAKGYKSGGFNAQSPAGSEEFGAEKSWSYETGIKTSWLKNRLEVNAAVFYIDWSDLQLDTPTATPAQFFIENAGKAYSKGFELEAIAHPIDNLDLFAGIGFVHAKFGGGSRNQGASISNNDLPYAPETTWNVGGQYTIKINKELSTYLRAEVFGTGQYFYDASNGASQDSYVLTNFRIGVAGKNWRLEGWMRNAFNEKYVPLAFPYQLASSGYIGEAGAPQTWGFTLGFSY